MGACVELVSEGCIGAGKGWPRQGVVSVEACGIGRGMRWCGCRQGSVFVQQGVVLVQAGHCIRPGSGMSVRSREARGSDRVAWARARDGIGIGRGGMGVGRGWHWCR